MEAITKLAISLVQNPEINFLTTNAGKDGEIIVTGEKSITLNVGDELLHPYFGRTLQVVEILELRKSKDCPKKDFYKISCVKL